MGKAKEASDGRYQQAARIIQEGAIGKVKEVHAWSEKKWGDPNPRPDDAAAVPAIFNWDRWLGIAAERPFIGNSYYHPGNWRKRLDFGAGTFGDMGCHIYDPVFNALQLTAPISVRSDGPAPNAWNWAVNSIVHYVFPGTAYTAGQTVNSPGTTARVNGRRSTRLLRRFNRLTRSASFRSTSPSPRAWANAERRILRATFTVPAERRAANWSRKPVMSAAVMLPMSSFVLPPR